jgi:Protein of unknown function (DUF4238)
VSRRASRVLGQYAAPSVLRTMPLHHYLPATYLGGFSLDQRTLPRRDRSLVAADLARGTCFTAPAAKLGAIKDFYALSGHQPDVVDNTWSAYETGLSEAIERLTNNTISALEWARVLVPFVACTLVRGHDFNERFATRFVSKGQPSPSPDNVNKARLFELQALLGVVAAADWHVLDAQGDGHFIVADLGFAPATSAVTGRIGVAVPLDRRHILLLQPCMTRVVATFRNGAWHPDIFRGTLEPNEQREFNGVLTQYATRFLFGASEADVKEHLTGTVAPKPPVPDPWDMGFSPLLSCVHDLSWHQLVSMLERGASEPTDVSFEIDWSALKQGWSPLTFIRSDLPHFSPPLALVGNDLVVHLYDPGLPAEAYEQGGLTHHFWMPPPSDPSESA